MFSPLLFKHSIAKFVLSSLLFLANIGYVIALLPLWKEIQLFGNTASGVSTSLSSLKTVTLTPSDSILFLSNSNSSIALIFISPLDKLEVFF